jgi:hypothetical protein
MPPPQAPGNHELTLGDVRADGFWSVSVYNADGFFELNPRNIYSVNNIRGTPTDEGLGHRPLVDYAEDAPNAIPTSEGWNTWSGCTGHGQRSKTAPGSCPTNATLNSGRGGPLHSVPASVSAGISVRGR